MKTDFVADVGNSRIKWGRCLNQQVSEIASLPTYQAKEWQKQFDVWSITKEARWVIAGVRPRSRQKLANWLKGRCAQVMVLDSWESLPLRIDVDEPSHVGIDRLLNAVAALTRCPAGVPAVLIDAGSAVTVDWLDESGTFCGGAIFPGLRLMAQSLQENTALLPFVESGESNLSIPGKSTSAAIKAGIYSAVVGGIRALIGVYRAMGGGHPPEVFVTGGDAYAVAAGLTEALQVWPEMTLEGIRIAAEALPEK